MKKLSIGFIIMIILSLLIVGCGGSNPPTPPSPTTSPTPPTTLTPSLSSTPTPPSAPTPTPTPPPTDLIDQINTLLDNVAAGMREHNSNKIISYLTDPVTMSTGDSKTLAEFKTALDSQFASMNLVDFQIIERTITIVDSNNATATLKEVVTIEGSPPAIPPSLEKFTFVKQGGNWKITAMSLP
jgi:hypothetical protein